MRGILLGLLVLLVGFAGCTGSEGTLVVQGSDPPDDIADFQSLVVQLSGLRVHASGGAEEDLRLNATSVDVVKLMGGNLTTLAQDQVAAGNYSWIKMDVTSASGALKAGGNVTVDVPADMLKLNGPFEVRAGGTTTLRIDLHVVKQGQGQYRLSPVIGSVR